MPFRISRAERKSTLRGFDPGDLAGIWRRGREAWKGRSVSPQRSPSCNPSTLLFVRVDIAEKPFLEPRGDRGRREQTVHV
jgi:hypothetical protein